MSEANDRENRVDLNRRDFLGKSGAALAAVGVAAQVGAGAAVGQDGTVAPIIKQTVLQSHMQKADSATLRIAKGLSAGLLEEVAEGASALADVFQATSEVNIQQTVARQERWQKGAIVAADHARLLSDLAGAAQERGKRDCG